MCFVWVTYIFVTLCKPVSLRWKVVNWYQKTRLVNVVSIWQYSPHFTRKSLRGVVGSGAVRGESVLAGGLKGCYWWKSVWRTKELHYYIQTENIKQLRAACSECTFTVSGACCDIILHWITLNSSEHKKDLCLLFVQWLWNKCFQDG
jgi:hypothetical protein